MIGDRLLIDIWLDIENGRSQFKYLKGYPYHRLDTHKYKAVYYLEQYLKLQLEDSQMTVREQLSKELEQAPESLVEEILDFCLFVKQRQQAKANNQAIAPKTNGILDLLESIKAIQAQVPNEEWDKIPHDGSINHDHYLYGSPKVEE